MRLLRKTAERIARRDVLTSTGSCRPRVLAQNATDLAVAGLQHKLCAFKKECANGGDQIPHA